MRFQKIIIREGFIYMAFVFMLSITAVTGPESELEERETLLAFLIEAGEINQEMAQSLRSECRNELTHAKKIVQDVELCYMKERSINREELYGRSSRVKTQEVLNVLCPQVKKMLVDCLRGKNSVFPFTGEKKDSDTWYSRYFESFQSSPRRRELAEKAGEASDPMPTIILAVGVTASVTFIICILLFYFCCASSFASGQNDENPLLSVSVSDNSIDSQKSLNLGASANEEKLGSQSLNNGLGHTKSSGNLYLESDSSSHSRSLNTSHSMNESRSLSISNKENSLGTNADDASNSLETSTQAPPPVFPPLKPPPGRVIPTSPSPVSSAPSLPSGPSAPTPPSPPGDRTPAPLAPMLPPLASPNAPAAPPALPGGAPVGPRPPGPPPPPGPRGGGPRPPGPPPPRGPPGPPGPRPPRGPGGHHAPSASVGDLDLGANKTKLKPFFWDKVNASADDTMVWNQIKAGSFQFNEEMIETLFGCAPTGKNKLGTRKDSGQESPKYIQIIDAKKAQNLSILLKALNVTTQEVRDALEEGNELPAELIQTLLKMAPTAEEELKLRLFTGELTQLGPAERFLKIMVDVPFAFKRLETIYFMSILEEDSAALRDAFVVLEAACTELRKSRLFLKLLEAVLKTGNRMNSGTFRGGAQAFKLDTLLKLSDVKGIDGKTTLLHFVVQEIIRGEGIRAVRAARELRSMSSFKSEDLSNDTVLDTDENLRSLGLQAVSRLGNDLENVKRAGALDLDNITGSVGRLGHALVKARDFLNTEMKSIEEDKGFRETLRGFVEDSEGSVKRLLEEEKRIAALIKSTADYFHGNSAKDEGLRLFTIVRDFLVILDKVCLEVKTTPAKPKEEKPKAEKAKEDDKANASTAKDEKPSDSKPTPPLQVPAAIAKKLSTVSGSSESSDGSDESDDSSSEDDEPTVKKIASRIITTPSPQQNSAIANRHPDSSGSSGDSDESGGSDSSSDEDKPTAKEEPPHPATPQPQPNSAIANRRSESQDDSDGTDGSNLSSEEEDKPNTSNTKEEEAVDAPPDSEKSTPAVADTVPDSSEDSSADEDENEDKARNDGS